MPNRMADHLMDDERIPDGALRIFQLNKHSRPSLVLASHCGQRYGVTYIQFPERGYPTGGASFAWPAELFREPSSPTEVLWAQQYLTAKRVRDLEAELVEAKADLEAVRRFGALIQPESGD